MQIADVGTWLEQNNSVHQLFAKATFKSETRKKRVRANSVMSAINPLSVEFKEVDEVVRVVSGFENTIDISYRYISVRAKEKYPNIDQARCIIVPMISKTEMFVFWRYHFFDSIDWEKRKIRGEIDWQTAVIGLKSDLQTLASEVMSDYENFLEIYLREKWQSSSPETKISLPPRKSDDD